MFLPSILNANASGRSCRGAIGAWRRARNCSTQHRHSRCLFIVRKFCIGSKPLVLRGLAAFFSLAGAEHIVYSVCNVIAEFGRIVSKGVVMLSQFSRNGYELLNTIHLGTCKVQGSLAMLSFILGTIFLMSTAVMAPMPQQGKPSGELSEKVCGAGSW